MKEVAPIVRREVAISEDGVYPEMGIRSFGKGTFHKPALTGFEVGTKRLYKIEAGDLMFIPRGAKFSASCSFILG